MSSKFLRLGLLIFLGSCFLLLASLPARQGSYVAAMSKANGDNIKEAGTYFGVFRNGAPENMAHIAKLEEQIGKKPAMIMWYQDWSCKFPKDEAETITKYGAVPQIVWEPWYWQDKSKVKLKDIVDGKWDNYIRFWAQDIKDFNQPIFIRLAHEFNLTIYPWGVPNNEQDPTLYIKAFRHVVDVFRREKVENVKWVWCFNNYSNPPNEAWNDWAEAYPGDKYVDWVGIDGYNWGKTQEWSGWETFKVLFRDQVRRAKMLWPTKPIMIAEFSSAEKGGDKAAWISEIPEYLKSSLRDIDAIIWFDIKKEADWRIKSSKESLAAFKEIMKDPVFLSDGPALAKHTVSGARNIAQKTAFALKAASPLTIDGDLADWNLSSPISMRDKSFFKEGMGWTGLDDLSGDAYIMWDETYFYVAAKIVDSTPLINTQQKHNVWNGDAIEIVLGLSQKADPKRVAFTSGDYQLGFGTGDGKSNLPSIWSWQLRRNPEDSEIKVVKTAEPLGYILEAKIPWEFFKGKFVPAKGSKIGFDIAFDDADQRGERQKQFIWNGDYYFYKDPSVWGILELK
ncbi:MAG: hypothetical protein KJ811_03455 [Candidatus Margulisbacteria bacterium]|nr:hypothetical protein [Candidatus Margulisiibacteriota bacterium]